MREDLLQVTCGLSALQSSLAVRCATLQGASITLYYTRAERSLECRMRHRFCDLLLLCGAVRNTADASIYSLLELIRRLQRELLSAHKVRPITDSALHLPPTRRLFFSGHKWGVRCRWRASPSLQENSAQSCTRRSKVARVQVVGEECRQPHKACTRAPALSSCFYSPASCGASLCSSST